MKSLFLVLVFGVFTDSAFAIDISGKWRVNGEVQSITPDCDPIESPFVRTFKLQKVNGKYLQYVNNNGLLILENKITADGFKYNFTFRYVRSTNGAECLEVGNRRVSKLNNGSGRYRNHYKAFCEDGFLCEFVTVGTVKKVR